MAINEFKAFAIGENANVIAQSEYEELEALTEGFQSGIARSEQLNKVWRQATTGVAALAQFISDTTNTDVLDNGEPGEFLANFIRSLEVKSLSRKNPFSDIAADGDAAIKEAFTNLRLRDAAIRDVGDGKNQLPDMSFFTSLKTAYGYQILPGGLIIQWGGLSGLRTGVESSVPLPISFPHEILQVVACHDNYTHFSRPTIYNVSKISKEEIFCSAIALNAPSVGSSVTRRADGEAAYGRWIAIGY